MRGDVKVTVSVAQGPPEMTGGSELLIQGLTPEDLQALSLRIDQACEEVADASYRRAAGRDVPAGIERYLDSLLAEEAGDQDLSRVPAELLLMEVERRMSAGTAAGDWGYCECGER